MKRVLIISAFWKPRIHVATNRMMAYAKYLREGGYEVTVLTLQDPSLKFKSRRFFEDGFEVILVEGRSFLNRSRFDLKSSFVVHKMKALKNKILNFLIADDEPGFFDGYRKISNEIAEGGYDFVLSSFAPLAAHRIALDLKKKNPNMQWIADFRDEMSFLPGLNAMIRRTLKSHEIEILNYCDYVCSVSQPLLKQLKSINEKPKFLEIRNGFDFSVNEATDRSSKNIFKIVYTGTFHGAMNPQKFFDILTLFRKKHPLQNIQFDLYCGESSIDIPVALQDLAKVHQKVPYEKVPEILEKANVLLLIQPLTTRTGVFSGKTFDYLAVNRPIFAMIPDNDVAAELIRESRSGVICPQGENMNAEGGLIYFEKIYFAWQKDELPARNWDLIRQQSRKNQISKLISALKVGSSII